jgi:hypothetical protein
VRQLAVALISAALLVVAAPALGKTTTHSCGGQFHVRAHGLSCKAAKKNLKNGSPGYTCKQVGHSTKPPFTIKCRKQKHPGVYYTYKTNGG